MAISERFSEPWSSSTSQQNIWGVTESSLTVGDRMFLLMSWKDFSLTLDSVVSGAAAWTQIGEFADGNVAQGNGTGSMKVAAWYRDFTGIETNVTSNLSGVPNISAATVIMFQKGAGETWDTPVFATAAIASATNWTATASTDPGITAGDLVIGLVGFRDDSATMTRSSSAGLDASGITWSGNYTEYPATHLSTTGGNDMSADAGYRIASSGTALAAPTMAGTLSATETGAAMFIRQRVSGGAVDVVVPYIGGGYYG